MRKESEETLVFRKFSADAHICSVTLTDVRWLLASKRLQMMPDVQTSRGFSATAELLVLIPASR